MITPCTEFILIVLDNSIVKDSISIYCILEFSDYIAVTFIYLFIIMEEIKNRYFDWTEILTQIVTEDMLQDPGNAKDILDHVVRYAGFLMKKEALEHKYHHKLRELHEEYGIDLHE